jgi:hypothetical protein
MEPNLIPQNQMEFPPATQRDPLDKGLVLGPHWLQPLRHESNAVGMKKPSKFVPATGNFSSVEDLNPLQGWVCCN